MILVYFSYCKRNTVSPETAIQFWEKLSIPDSISFMNILVSKQGTLIASTGDYPYEANKDGYIFRSTDFGTNWDEIDLGVKSVSSLLEYQSLLFSGTTQGIYKSVDDGVTWQASGLDSVWVRSLASYTDSESNFILAGTSKGIFKSSNIGQTWNKLANVWHAGCVGILNEDIIFAGFIGAMSADLKVSRDGGMTWDFTSLGLGADAINIKGRKIYAGGWRGEEWIGGLFVSIDEGRSWSEIFSNLKNVGTILITQNNTIYIGGIYTGVQMMKSGDSNWIELNSGLSSLWITCLAIDNNNYLYAASDLGGIYKSKDPVE